MKSGQCESCCRFVSVCGWCKDDDAPLHGFDFKNVVSCGKCHHLYHKRSPRKLLVLVFFLIFFLIISSPVCWPQRISNAWFSYFCQGALTEPSVRAASSACKFDNSCRARERGAKASNEMHIKRINLTKAMEYFRTWVTPNTPSVTFIQLVANKRLKISASGLSSSSQQAVCFLSNVVVKCVILQVFVSAVHLSDLEPIYLRASCLALKASRS